MAGSWCFGFPGLPLVVLMAPGNQEDSEEVLDLEGIDVPSESPRRVSTICLAGKLISEKSYNTFAMIDVMVKAFKPKGKLQARDWVGWSNHLFF